MSNIVSAILLDTRGIQKYVFSSNKLKTNIGASYLVDIIFSEWMKNIVEKENEVEKDKCEIAYIGGGNMLIFVDDDDELKLCKKIVGEWSKKVLLEAPGLKTGVALTNKFDKSKEKYQESRNELYKQLKANQNNIMPNVDLPYTGLTLECDFTGKVADSESKLVDNSTGKVDVRKVSAEAYAKLDAATKADAKLVEDYFDNLRINENNYGFVSEIEKIGYQKGESYISVIHIDGNNMGVKFRECKDLEAYKALSGKVVQAVKNAFSNLLGDIYNDYPYDKKYIDNNIKDSDNKILLPIRPIIIGGDDVTFVCPGRLGLDYAKKYVEYALAEKVIGDSGLSCCAGVAIVPAKYPFFRAYELAEQLCSVAKKKSRQDDSSWLEFAILHGEAYPELEQLRQNQYVGVGKRNMHYGPYLIGNPAHSHSIDNLFALRKALWKLHKDSRNKLKGLREVLFKDDHSIKVYLEKNKALVENLQKDDGISFDVDLLWETVDGVETTRFIDAIEIMDYVVPEEEK